MAPTEKFSTSTSALPIMRRNTSRPGTVLRLRVTNFLFEFSMANGTAAPPTVARRRRFSPPIGSTLITSAPAIAIMKVQ